LRGFDWAGSVDDVSSAAGFLGTADLVVLFFFASVSVEELVLEAMLSRTVGGAVDSVFSETFVVEDSRLSCCVLSPPGIGVSDCKLALGMRASSGRGCSSVAGSCGSAGCA